MRAVKSATIYARQAQVKSLNRILRMHWRKRHEERSAWFLAVLAVLGHARPSATERRKVAITVYRARELDSDNLIGGCKYLRDALTAYGWIVDDSPKWADFDYHYKKSKTIDERVLVEITE